MVNNDLIPYLQSAYRQNHSNETALIKVKNDLLKNMNKGHVTLLVLLDLSAAFDTVVHTILLRRLQSLLRPKQTGRDSETRREFSIFNDIYLYYFSMFFKYS
jgi:hypothetical protein